MTEFNNTVLTTLVQMQNGINQDLLDLIILQSHRLNYLCYGIIFLGVFTIGLIVMILILNNRLEKLEKKKVKVK